MCSVCTVPASHPRRVTVKTRSTVACSPPAASASATCEGRQEVRHSDGVFGLEAEDPPNRTNPYTIPAFHLAYPSALRSARMVLSAHSRVRPRRSSVPAPGVIRHNDRLVALLAGRRRNPGWTQLAHLRPCGGGHAAPSSPMSGRVSARCGAGNRGKGAPPTAVQPFVPEFQLTWRSGAT